ncbi:polyadenylate-binding protein 4-like [Leptinotarsa decemlineata]|uniref:polyadenylate-binding protein 4-like n=1 Tax=Leptinotarsa decemlineata TaxID=7539 RepID=UPI003D304F97
MERVNYPFFDNSRTLYIGEVPLGISDEELHRYYSAYGEIKTVIVSADSKTSVSRGYGYIQFRSAESMKAALQGENFTKMNVRSDSGHFCGVRKSYPLSDVSKVNYPLFDNSKTLYIGEIPWYTSDAELESYYSAYGGIKAVIVLADSRMSWSRGHGYIEFRLAESLKAALPGRNLTKMNVCSDSGHSCGVRESYPLSDVSKVNYPLFDNSKTLYIGEIPRDTSDAELESYYSAYGGIKAVIVLADSRMSWSRGHGYIEFRLAESLKAALQGKYFTEMNVRSDSGHSYGMRESYTRSDVSKVNYPLFDNSKTLYIGEIPRNTSDAELESYYSAYGGIQAVIVLADSRISWSRGHGYIEFKLAESLKAALQGKKMTSTIVLSDSSGVSESYPQLYSNETLYIGGVPWECSDAELQDYYEQYGEVASVTVVASSNISGQRGDGFIVFRKNEDLKRALANEA